MVDVWDTCSQRKYSTSQCCVYFSRDSWHTEWKPLHIPSTPHAPPPAPFCSFGCTPSSVIQQLEQRQEGRRDGGELEGKQSGGWWRNLEKESVSVAPTESAEGKLGEIGLLVRGCSWKVCRSHWAGTVADKGTLVLMKSSLLSYQSMRVLVWGSCLCALMCVWKLSPSLCCEFFGVPDLV